MRDFLPTEKARREAVLSIIRDTYRTHGFDEIETPVMDGSDRLHAGLGGDNEKLAYAVMKRGLAVDDLRAAGDPLELADLGLRFDLTVPLARFYASNRASLPDVFRAIQIGSVWRAERPQKGRFRQFVQCDIDIIGEAGPLAEVELLIATFAVLDAIELTECSIRINDRRILRGLTDHFGIPAESYVHALVVFDKEDKIGVEGVVAELRELGLGDSDLIARTLRAQSENAADGWSLLDSPPAWLDLDAYRELAFIRDAVGDSRRLVFAPTLVRGMGYYTGPIFEIAHPRLAYSLGGGGRYDGMIGRFLGTDVPATGFSLGFERLVDLVTVGAGPDSDGVALIHDNVPVERLAAIKSALIARGSRVRLERQPRNVKPLLAQLAASGFARFAYLTAETEGLDDLEFRELG